VNDKEQFSSNGTDEEDMQSESNSKLSEQYIQNE
jgi:hypothetical protein